MSRPKYRQTTGVIFAVVALIFGITAAAAIGWANEETTQGGETPTSGEQDHGGKKDHGDKKEEGEQPPTQTEETPPTVTQEAPPTVTPPAQTTTPPPVTAQGPPSTPTTPESPPVTTEQGPPTTSAPPTTTTPKAPPLAPVAERKQLASTGLSPALIALFGAAFLGGGAFLFRRSLVRD
jgi:hypothetical protein